MCLSKTVPREIDDLLALWREHNRWAIRSVDGLLNSAQNKTFPGSSTPAKQRDEVCGFQNHIERAMLIFSKSAVTNNGCERSMLANSILRRLHNLPFAR